MTKPVRLRLSRAKGFNLQAHSRQVNGLPAQVVARPSTWGNPYKVIGGDRHGATVKFRDWLHCCGPETTAAIRNHLRGHNLACWCPLPEPGQPDHCHAAVLLEVANG
jgi:hypothetical protein